MSEYIDAPVIAYRWVDGVDEESQNIYNYIGAENINKLLESGDIDKSKLEPVTWETLTRELAEKSSEISLLKKKISNTSDKGVEIHSRF